MMTLHDISSNRWLLFSGETWFVEGAGISRRGAADGGFDPFLT